QAGSAAFEPGRHYSYVPHLLGDAQRGANHLSITRTPLNADLAIFDLDGDGIADHIGIFDRWLDADETRYQTVEGNVSLSAEQNVRPPARELAGHLRGEAARDPLGEGDAGLAGQLAVAMVGTHHADDAVSAQIDDTDLDAHRHQHVEPAGVDRRHRPSVQMG